MARRLPVGIQSFEEIRNREYVYVDKTQYIYQLANTGKVYFLSRPRRFGKSLFVSALDAFFSGRKELFHGLAIEKLEEENPIDASGKPWVKGPVVHFDFGPEKYSSVEDLRAVLDSMLSQYEEIYGRSENDKTLSRRFMRLLRNMYEKTGIKAAVLIDEYDKPLTSTMKDEEKDLNDQLGEELKAFYGVLKSADQYTKFVLLTGVTKFSHVSIFGDLNNLNDISLDSRYNAVCGMTEEEIKMTFGPELEILARTLGTSPEEAMQKIADWYDGYHFGRSGEGIFNPFSVLSVLERCEFKDYWFQSGTPTFLVDKIKDVSFSVEDMSSGIKAKEETFTSYRNGLDEPLPLLYQSGYLSIKSYDSLKQTYTLAFPNREVKYSFLGWMIPVYFTDTSAGTGMTADEFSDAVRAGDVDG